MFKNERPDYLAVNRDGLLPIPSPGGHAQTLRLRVDREAVAMTALDDLPARHALSAYDAVYLELALRRSLPLATTDAALPKAMAAAGVARAEL